MSLLLLFGGNVTSVVIIDAGIKPTIVAVENQRSNLLFVERSNAVFQETTTTYNDPSVMYSDPNQTYGGSDRKQSMGQTPTYIVNEKPYSLEVITEKSNNTSVENIKPQMLKIGK